MGSKSKTFTTDSKQEIQSISQENNSKPNKISDLELCSLESLPQKHGLSNDLPTLKKREASSQLTIFDPVHHELQVKDHCHSLSQISSQNHHHRDSFRKVPTSKPSGEKRSDHNLLQPHVQSKVEFQSTVAETSLDSQENIKETTRIRPSHSSIFGDKKDHELSWTDLLPKPQSCDSKSKCTKSTAAEGGYIYTIANNLKSAMCGSFVDEGVNVAESFLWVGADYWKYGTFNQDLLKKNFQESACNLIIAGSESLLYSLSVKIDSLQSVMSVAEKFTALLPPYLRPLVSIISCRNIIKILQYIKACGCGEITAAKACTDIFNLIGSNIFTTYGVYLGSLVGACIGGIGGPGGAAVGVIIGAHVGSRLGMSLYELFVMVLRKLLDYLKSLIKSS